MLSSAVALTACNPSAATQATRQTGAAPVNTPGSTGPEDRTFWLQLLLRIADPVLNNLAQGTLHANMPLEANPGQQEFRSLFTHLEAVGRLLAGMAPWLELSGLTGAEEELRQRYAGLAVGAVNAIIDPQSPDGINFVAGRQNIVDAAYLSHAFLRAPKALWEPLAPPIKERIAHVLQATRVLEPYQNNWLLFSAMIETFLHWSGNAWDRPRVDNALRQHEDWYKGDGVYGDGPEFRWDYYNSFVIHPMLLDILEHIAPLDSAYGEMQPRELVRAQRYAMIQERLIAPDGTYPPLGRSLTYRFGAFQLLGQMALQHTLPDNLPAAQVRSALNAVIRRVASAPGMFDDKGWLKRGLVGHQPSLSEDYISTGSLYMCAMGLLPLGLPPDDAFWSAPAQDWSAKRIWAGEDAQLDKAL